MSCAIVEKTRGNNAVLNALQVLGKVPHGQHVIADKCRGADRRIIAQLNPAIDVLDQIGTIRINGSRGTYPGLRLNCGRAEYEDGDYHRCNRDVPDAQNLHAKYLFRMKFCHTGERSEWSRVAQTHCTLRAFTFLERAA